MNNNIIKFPKGKKDAPPQSLEETLERVETARKEHIEYVVDEVLSYAFSRLADEGFDLADEDHAKHTALLIKSFEAALYKCSRLDHPLHELAEKMFTFENDVEIAVDFLIKKDDSTEDESLNKDS